MDLATLNISKQQAAEAVVHYRKALKKKRSAEDAAILRGYNQIVKDRKLIRLSKIIAAGGADEQHRPRLAVLRADFKRCFVHATWRGSVIFSPDNQPHWRHRGLRVEFPNDTLPSWDTSAWTVDAWSVVPIIPPQHRPPDDLANYHILWEASWTDVPRDPALLKHLGGDLYAVLAVWDLTDLERAVLAGRR